MLVTCGTNLINLSPPHPPIYIYLIIYLHIERDGGGGQTEK